MQPQAATVNIAILYLTMLRLTHAGAHLTMPPIRTVWQITIIVGSVGGVMVLLLLFGLAIRLAECYAAKPAPDTQTSQPPLPSDAEADPLGFGEQQRGTGLDPDVEATAPGGSQRGAKMGDKAGAQQRPTLGSEGALEAATAAAHEEGAGAAVVVVATHRGPVTAPQAAGHVCAGSGDVEPLGMATQAGEPAADNLQVNSFNRRAPTAPAEVGEAGRRGSEQLPVVATASELTATVPACCIGELRRQYSGGTSAWVQDGGAMRGGVGMGCIELPLVNEGCDAVLSMGPSYASTGDDVSYDDDEDCFNMPQSSKGSARYTCFAIPQPMKGLAAVPCAAIPQPIQGSGDTAFIDIPQPIKAGAHAAFAAIPQPTKEGRVSRTTGDTLDGDTLLLPLPPEGCYLGATWAGVMPPSGCAPTGTVFLPMPPSPELIKASPRATAACHMAYIPSPLPQRACRVQSP